MIGQEPKQGHDTAEVELENLMQSASQAAKNGDERRYQAVLGTIGECVEGSTQLKIVFFSKFDGIIRSLPNLQNVAMLRCALPIVEDSLVSLRRTEWSPEDIAVSSTVLKAIHDQIFSVPLPTELFKPTFDILSRWCSFSKAHRGAFLDVFPIANLREYDVESYSLDTLISFVELSGSILGQGAFDSPLFSSVLKIFEKALSCKWSTCEITEQACNSILRALKDFQDEDPVEEVLRSRIITYQIRHATMQEPCEKHCVVPIMKLVVECLKVSGQNWRQLVDHGILDFLDMCLKRNHSEVFKDTCWTLATVLAYSPDSVGDILSLNLVGPLFLLREHREEDVEREARSVLQRLFAQAEPHQISAFYENGYLPHMAKLLRSKKSTATLDGLRWLFAVISATRHHRHDELSKIQQHLIDLDVLRVCKRLEDCEDTTIRSLARGLFNFVACKFDD